MSSAHLIDSVVRQTMVLIAHLATRLGGRAPVGHVADEVLTRLVAELKTQGLSHKVVADMLGMGLRTYHRRVRALAEGSTDRGRPLWEAVLEFVRERGSALRADVLNRFPADDEAIVRAVLSDLVDSGLVFRAGRGAATIYRAATVEELGAVASSGERDAIASLVWVVVHRFGPLDRGRVGEVAGLTQEMAEEALAPLLADGRVLEADDGLLTSPRCVIALGAPEGWEAALLDHYQAMVTAMMGKLRGDRRHARAADTVGGSTWTFDLWDGHPQEQEVLALLARTRREVGELRRRAAGAGAPSGARRVRVLFYAGQAVIDEDDASTLGVRRGADHADET